MSFLQWERLQIIGKIRVRKLSGEIIKDLIPTIEEVDRFIREKDYYERNLSEIEVLKKAEKRKIIKNKKNKRLCIWKF